MKSYHLLFVLFLVSSTCLCAQTEFVLEPSQSMLMSGKGEGQDATINPYLGEDCVAVIENIGEREFYVRVEQPDVQLDKYIIPYTINVGQTKKIELPKGARLYLDPNPKGLAKARVDYEKVEE